MNNYIQVVKGPKPNLYKFIKIKTDSIVYNENCFQCVDCEHVYNYVTSVFKEQGAYFKADIKSINSVIRKATMYEHKMLMMELQ